MIPTVGQVLRRAAEELGDPKQRIFTDDVLLGPSQTAFSDMYRLMDKWGLPKINRVEHYNLPAYTNLLVPATANIDDMGAPKKIWERGSLTTTSVSGATNATPIVLTVASGTGFSSNQKATVDGVSGPTGRINGEWFISVSGTAVTLTGSIAAGVWQSGGTLTQSSDDFREMSSVDRVFGLEDSSTNSLDVWAWRDDVFWFTGATEQRQLRIEYESSGSPPVSGTVGVDGALDFLAYRTAGLAAPKRGLDDRARDCTFIALGKSGQADGDAGLLHDLFVNDLQEKHKRGRRPQPFRRRRQHYLNISS